MYKVSSLYNRRKLQGLTPIYTTTQKKSGRKSWIEKTEQELSEIRGELNRVRKSVQAAQELIQQFEDFLLKFAPKPKTVFVYHV